MLLGNFSVGNVAVGGIPNIMNCIAHEYDHGWVRHGWVRYMVGTSLEL